MTSQKGGGSIETFLGWMDSLDPEFGKIADLWMETLIQDFGTDHWYQLDGYFNGGTAPWYSKVIFTWMHQNSLPTSIQIPSFYSNSFYSLIQRKCQYHFSRFVFKRSHILRSHYRHNRQASKNLKETQDSLIVNGCLLMDIFLDAFKTANNFQQFKLQCLIVFCILIVVA